MATSRASSTGTFGDANASQPPQEEFKPTLELQVLLREFKPPQEKSSTEPSQVFSFLKNSASAATLASKDTVPVAGNIIQRLKCAGRMLGHFVHATFERQQQRNKDEEQEISFSSPSFASDSHATTTPPRGPFPVDSSINLLDASSSAITMHDYDCIASTAAVAGLPKAISSHNGGTEIATHDNDPQLAPVVHGFNPDVSTPGSRTFTVGDIGSALAQELTPACYAYFQSTFGSGVPSFLLDMSLPTASTLAGPSSTSSATTLNFRAIVFDPGITGHHHTLCLLPLSSIVVSTMKHLWPTQAGEGDTPLSSVHKICHDDFGNGTPTFQAGEGAVFSSFFKIQDGYFAQQASTLMPIECLDFCLGH